jgi:hypothetical protein
MTPRHGRLPVVLEEAEVLSTRLDIPVRMVSAHRELKQGRNQYAVRWGAFLLAYAPTEGFFNAVLAHRSGNNRVLPLNPDKVRRVAKEADGVDIFSQVWSVRTRTLHPGRGNRSRWHTYAGVNDIRDYLADMKSLRDLLSHGGDPYGATNTSGALWEVKKGASMRLMGVEGFIQACCDLAGQTILAYGGRLDQIPGWPEPERSGLSAEKRPPLTLLP